VKIAAVGVAGASLLTLLGFLDKALHSRSVQGLALAWH
jgi:hypothetical protein